MLYFRRKNPNARKKVKRAKGLQLRMTCFPDETFLLKLINTRINAIVLIFIKNVLFYYV